MLSSRCHWFVTLLCLPGFAALPAYSAEPVRFARTPDISPDGSLVAFSYLGDVWTVPALGGVARPVTMHQAHELHPVFSPDGKRLAFSSNRHGQYDVFVVGVLGGRPTRLTFDSADDFVTGWTPDGGRVLFSSSREIDYPPRDEMYSVPAAGGGVRRHTPAEGREGVVSPDGKLLAYTRGPGTWYRKGYRGSSNDEVWVCDLDGKNHRQVTKFHGQDNWPCWSPDGWSLYYVTDAFGTPANVVRQRLSLKGDAIAVIGEPEQVTKHRADGVRKARLSRDGEWLVYECGADLYVASTKGGPARRLLIEAYADEKTNAERVETYSSGATEMAVAPDERNIAFVVHGELFLVSRTGGTATRLTEHPADDHGVAWAPDGSALYFLSDRSGYEDVYRLEPDDPAGKRFGQAQKFKITRVTDTPEAELGLMFSPDGSRLAFLRGGKLVTVKADGGDEVVVAGEPRVIDYEWSPDSKRLCYSRQDGSYASELYIVPAGGATAADPPRNITRYATYNAGVTWSATGNSLCFLSERGADGERHVYLLDLQRPATADAPRGPGIDWEGIPGRAQRVSSRPAKSAAISPDGKSIAFVDEETNDVWVAGTDGTLNRISTGGIGASQLHWSSLLSSLLYFRDGRGQLRLVSITSKNDPLRVPFLARLTIDRDEEFLEIFEQSWRAVYEQFYDPTFHGVDWKGVRDRYWPLVAHVAEREDLDALLSVMLGELNASHLGIDSPGDRADLGTAYLGLLFESGYTGPGLKIGEILRGGPADLEGLKLKAGDVVLTVDGEPVGPDSNYARAVAGKEGFTARLQVTPDPADPKATRQVEVKAVSRSKATALMYNRWVGRNAEEVDRLSGGRLGYIHIPSLDAAGLKLFLRSLYSDNWGRDGIVLDVRFNAGGYTHDKVLSYLGGKEHTYFVQRDGGVGSVFRHADRRYTKPLVLLINNKSFSDAEIFPSAFRTLGLGKIVGVPTGGRVIGTGTVKLIDGSTFRVPRTGIFTRDGVNMERQGVKPDVEVENHPDRLAQGVDEQLHRAVTVLEGEVREWRRANPEVTFTPGAGPAKGAGR